MENQYCLRSRKSAKDHNALTVCANFFSPCITPKGNIGVSFHRSPCQTSSAMGQLVLSQSFSWNSSSLYLILGMRQGKRRLLKRSVLSPSKQGLFSFEGLRCLGPLANSKTIICLIGKRLQMFGKKGSVIVQRGS